MTKAYFTIEADLPDGVTHEDFRFWAEHELRCAVGGTDADDPLRKLKRDKIVVRSVTSPSIGSFYRPENYVKASDGYAVAKNRNNVKASDGYAVAKNRNNGEASALIAELLRNMDEPPLDPPAILGWDLAIKIIKRRAGLEGEG